MEIEKFGAARRASSLTVEKAASLCGVSRPTYNARERNPLDFRLCELRSLYDSLDDIGKRLLFEGVVSVFDEGEKPLA